MMIHSLLIRAPLQTRIPTRKQTKHKIIDQPQAPLPENRQLISSKGDKTINQPQGTMKKKQQSNQNKRTKQSTTGKLS